MPSDTPYLMSLSGTFPMLTSCATVISRVSGVETFRTPAGIMGTLRRAALSTVPALNVSCWAVDERELSMYDACASSQVGVMV